MKKLRNRYGNTVLHGECAYGENAYQTPAGHYVQPDRDHPLALHRFELVAGNPMSYNNKTDLDRLARTFLRVVAGFRKTALFPHIALIAKHGNCCGAAYNHQHFLACEKAAKGDELAAFGGFVLTTGMVDEKEAASLSLKTDGSRQLFDSVAAGGFTMAAAEKLGRKTGKCRLLTNSVLFEPDYLQTPSHVRRREVLGGFLIQPEYSFVLDLKAEYVICDERAGEPIENDLIFAWAIGSTSNSNTITLVKNGMLIGNAVGQQDRVGAAELALVRARRGGHDTNGAVAYSDSFFPFPDGVQVLLDAGVSAILTSSGSTNDKLTIAACKSVGVPLYMVPDKLARGFYGH
jgi:phosphoribosylaminoimidazolecarboxamide formyltransferase / IMP cyclohydrolase